MTQSILEQKIAPKTQRLLTIDFETYYDFDYGLSKLTTSGYILDHRFEVIGVGVVEGAERHWLSADEFRKFAQSVDWGTTCVLAHHAHFDALILSRYFGIRPGFIADTLSMANLLGLSSHVGGSLEKLAEHFGIGHKGREVLDAKGKHREDFTPAQLAAYGLYCLNDCALTFELFKRMEPLLPIVEMAVIDFTVKCFSEPSIYLNANTLQLALTEEREKKRSALALAGVSQDDLASNPRFAEVLQSLGIEPPVKISKTTGKETFAFAKSDPGMQELLEHPSDNIRAIAEARLSVKSTIAESRIGRMLALGNPAPIYLKVGAAHTQRWGGGDKTNFQNLPRKGPLRDAIEAPPGHVLVACDSAQIEARGAAWLTGQADLVKAFSENRDVYSEFASTIYGRKIDRKKNKEDAIPGFLGKTCLGPETPIVTDRGVIPLRTVTVSDRVWDGLEWVTHSGVIPQGEKETWGALGVHITADHEILTGNGWQEWGAVLTSPSLLKSALNSATLPYYVGTDGSLEVKMPVFSRSSNADADGKGLFTGKTCLKEGPLSATRVENYPPPERGGGNINPPAQTTRTELGCLTGFLPVSPDAKTLKTSAMYTTGLEESQFFQNGKSTEANFCTMLNSFQAGIIQNSSLTESIVTGDTRRGISDLSPGPKISEIREKSLTSSHGSEILKLKMPVFDILSAGPRHRFTIMTDAGPLIVHNCILGLGYAMGWSKFSLTLLAGAMGGPPVQFTKKDAASMLVDVESFKAKHPGRLKRLVSRLSPDDLAVHCAVSARLIKLYRDKNYAIADFWKRGDELISSMANGVQCPLGPGGVFKIERGAILRPSGLKLIYPGLKKRLVKRENEETGELEEREVFGYLGGLGQVKYVHGGLLLENITQAFCRDIIALQASRLRWEYGLKIVTTTHDEIVTCVPEKEGDAALKTMVEVMRTPPDWCRGLPLNAEGGFAKSYGDCK